LPELLRCGWMQLRFQQHELAHGDDLRARSSDVQRQPVRDADLRLHQHGQQSGLRADLRQQRLRYDEIGLRDRHSSRRRQRRPGLQGVLAIAVRGQPSMHS
jgi:hypothetical protein